MSLSSTPATPDVVSKHHKHYLGFKFKKLDHRDLKHILTKLNKEPAPRACQPPRKCRRLTKTQQLIADLSSETRPGKMNFVGNKKIGDKGMDYLHLIPDSVTDLDFSDCGLGPKGVIKLCTFLEGNKHITRMTLWGNEIDDEAAKAVGKMLAKNDTLQILCLNPDVPESLRPHLTAAAAAQAVCVGLSKNQTLEELSFVPHFPDIDPMDDLEWLQEFTIHFPLEGPRLQRLEVSYGSFIDMPGGHDHDMQNTFRLLCRKWEHVLRDNTHLRKIPFLATTMSRYYLDLNKASARNVVGEEDQEEWLRSLTIAHENQNLNVLNYLIRNKPEMCAL